MKITNESGRSMVEMLGVLAIIGVLSIGAIAGYSMAMNRYRANETLDIAAKYAVVLFSAKQKSLAFGTNDEIPNLKTAGLNTKEGSDSTTPGGSLIAKDKVTFSSNGSGVQLEISFPSEGVCNAATSILGIGTTEETVFTDCKHKSSCSVNGGTIQYCFKQS